GFFTYFLVQAWQGNADNDPCDGRITADELVEYVHTNVRRYAKDHDVSQTPTARGDYEPTMILGVGRGCLTSDNKEPSMLGSAIVESNMDDVELYIDGTLIGRLSKDKPLVVPRLSRGLHEFKGGKTGHGRDRKKGRDCRGRRCHGHAADPLRETDQERRDRSERRRRKAAADAAVVVVGDERDSDRAPAERKRPEARQRSVHPCRGRGSDVYAGDVQPRAGESAARGSECERGRLQESDGRRSQSCPVAHSMRRGVDRARRS